jgi:hypothetical protein
MPVANPEYKPDWQEIHDHHNEERQRLSEEKDAVQDQWNELFRAGKKYDDPELSALDQKMNALQTEWDVHHEACMHILNRNQHETVQDCAKWLFEGFFNPDESWEAEKIKHVTVLDYEKFTTLDEVFAERNRTGKAIDEQYVEAEQRLPVGQPDGLNAFIDDGESQIKTEWMTFTREELYGNNLWAQVSVADTHEALVTVEKRDGQYNVCIAEDPKVAHSTLAQSDVLATAIYNRIREAEGHDISKPQNLGAAVKGLLSGIANSLYGKFGGSTVYPEQFNFFVQNGPSSRGSFGREHFFKVDMKYEHGFGFSDRERQTTPYNQTPEVISNAYYNRHGDIPDAQAPQYDALEHEGAA